MCGVRPSTISMKCFSKKTGITGIGFDVFLTVYLGILVINQLNAQFFLARGSVHHKSMFKIQPDATVCGYLYTA